MGTYKIDRTIKALVTAPLYCSSAVSHFFAWLAGLDSVMADRNGRNTTPPAVSSSDADGCSNEEEEMSRPNQPQNAGEPKIGPGTKRMMETKAPPTKIPNKMKYVLDNGLRRSLGNYKTPE